MQLCGLTADKTRKKYVFFDKKVFKLIFILTFAHKFLNTDKFIFR
jgi:hypothetical protein